MFATISDAEIARWLTPSAVIPELKLGRTRCDSH